MKTKRKRRGLRIGAPITVHRPFGGVMQERIRRVGHGHIRSDHGGIWSRAERGVRWALGWTSKEAEALRAAVALVQ